MKDVVDSRSAICPLGGKAGITWQESSWSYDLVPYAGTRIDILPYGLIVCSCSIRTVRIGRVAFPAVASLEDAEV